MANLTHRLHWIKNKPYNWNAFFAAASRDESIVPVIKIVQALWVDGHSSIFCSGRPERTRDDTMNWLQRHVVPSYSLPDFAPPLYMRPDNDTRADYIIKMELLAKIRADGYDPQMAIDDRLSVCKMWEAAGIMVLAINCGKEF